MGRVLKVVVCAALLSALSGAASTSVSEIGPRELSFVHLHTGETLSVVFKRDGQWVPQSLRQLDEFLGDFRTGEVRAFDPELFDLLYLLQQRLDSGEPYEVISAYRSPATNEMLRQGSQGVAKRSLHMEAKAIDVRLADVDTRKLRETALELGLGGVGYYEEDDFVHLDTGRARWW